MLGKCLHQIFEKDRFQNYTLGYSKHVKFSCLHGIVNLLFAGENKQEMGKMHCRINVL